LPRLTEGLLRGAFLSGNVDYDLWTIDPKGMRPAGVAVLLSLSPEPLLHLVLRSRHLADHAGEIGFPGGKPDAGDADLRATAARELFEEVGVAEAQIEWLGTLSPCPVITGRYMIHPFVALLAEGVVPRVASGEVAEVLALPIGPYLSGEERIVAIEVEWRGVAMVAPHFPVGGHVLYGATAYIAYELLVRLAVAMGSELLAPKIEASAPWGNRYALK